MSTAHDEPLGSQPAIGTIPASSAQRSRTTTTSRRVVGRRHWLRRHAGLAMLTACALALALAGGAAWLIDRDDGVTTRTFSVDSKTLWHDTDVVLESGDRLDLKAWGEFRDDPGRPERLFRPDGKGRADGDVAEELPHGALLGRWGSEGRPFLVGSSMRITASTASNEIGRLYLTVNDVEPLDPDDRGFSDNEGAFEVRAVVTPRA